MGKGRLEAFSDGVIAVALTIMVLDLKAPHADNLDALHDSVRPFLCYILSFLYVGIYWNNHHHLLHAAKHVSGMTLWANLHLLFWITLIPFVTGWMGETGFRTWPVAAYGIVLLMCAMAWQVLVSVLLKCHGKDSLLGKAIGEERKEWLSLVLYIAGIGAALAGGWLDHEKAGGIIGCAIYTVVAAIWFIPDQRIERRLRQAAQSEQPE